jgi:hypothetical protein
MDMVGGILLTDNFYDSLFSEEKSRAFNETNEIQRKRDCPEISRLDEIIFSRFLDSRP